MEKIEILRILDTYSNEDAATKLRIADALWALYNTVEQGEQFYCACSRAKGLDHDEEGMPYCIECQKPVQYNCLQRSSCMVSCGFNNEKLIEMNKAEEILDKHLENRSWTKTVPKYGNLYNTLLDVVNEALSIADVVGRSEQLPQDKFCNVCNLPTDGKKCYSKRCPI